MIFVTGVSGDLGRTLAAQGNVVGSVHARAAPPGVRAHTLDVRDAGAVRRSLEAERPAVVIHTAYRQDDDSVTRDGAAVVAAESARIGARLIHLSSDLVFAGTLGRPLAEDDVARRARRLRQGQGRRRASRRRSAPSCAHRPHVADPGSPRPATAPRASRKRPDRLLLR